ACQQAFGEAKPGADVIGIARQNLPEAFGGAIVLALEQQRRAETVQGADVTRRMRQGAGERDLGIRRIGAADVDAAELDRKLGDRRRRLKAALESRLGFFVTAHRAQQDTEIAERGRKWWLAHGGALQPLDRFSGAANVA